MYLSSIRQRGAATLPRPGCIIKSLYNRIISTKSWHRLHRSATCYTQQQDRDNRAVTFWLYPYRHLFTLARYIQACSDDCYRPKGQNLWPWLIFGFTVVARSLPPARRRGIHCLNIYVTILTYSPLVTKLVG